MKQRASIFFRGHRPQTASIVQMSTSWSVKIWVQMVRIIHDNFLKYAQYAAHRLPVKVTVRTGSCHFDKLRCSQWQKGRHNDNLYNDINDIHQWIWRPSPEQSTAKHYCDVIMGAMASQITSLIIVYSNVYSGTDQRKYQSSASLTFVRGIHRWPVNSPHKWPVTRKIFPFDDVIMNRVYLYLGHG